MSLGLESHPVHISQEKQAIYVNEMLEVTSDRSYIFSEELETGWGPEQEVADRGRQCIQGHWVPLLIPYSYQPQAPVLPAFLPPEHLFEV